MAVARFVSGVVRQLWGGLRAYLALVWFHVSRCLLFEWWVHDRPCTPTYHKVVVIGDEIAEGWGDWVLCGKLPEMVQRRARLSPLTPCRRMVNRGLMYSTTADWLPSAGKPPLRRVWRAYRSSLWTHAFQRSVASRDAEIVVVCLGSGELMRSPSSHDTIVANLKLLCEALQRQGKFVFLCTLPLPAGDCEEMRTLFHAVNTRLREFVFACSRDGAVQMGADLGADRTFAASLDEEGRMDTKGYSVFADQVKQAITNSMVQIEFQTWKRLLGQ